MAIVAGGAIAARTIATSSWNSVVGYHSPYRFTELEPPGEALVNRVVLVVMDGLRLDTSRQVAELNKLRAHGADFVATVGQPSLSNPARAVMASGAWQEFNGVTNNSHYTPPTIDNIFVSAQRANVPVALAGIDFWRDNYDKLVAENFHKFGKEPHDQGPAAIMAYQNDLCDGITGFLHQSKARLQIVDLTAIDIISHDIGPVSGGNAARTVIDSVDHCLGRVAAEVNLADSVIIVTSDHGHIDTGGHGGNERVVMEVPLVIAGQHVVQRDAPVVTQADIAPTICGLLGLPFPAGNSGTFLSWAFDLPSSFNDALIRRLVRQRSAQLREWERVFDAHAAEKRRLPAAIAGIFLALAALALFWIARLSATERWCLVGGIAAYYVSYYLLFEVMELAYSLSAVNREEFLTRFLAKGMLASGFALLLATPVMVAAWRKDPTWAGAWRLASLLAAIIALTLAAQVDWLYLVNGLTITDRIFNLTLAFRAYLTLLALVALPFATLLGAPLLMIDGRNRRKL